MKKPRTNSPVLEDASYFYQLQFLSWTYLLSSVNALVDTGFASWFQLHQRRVFEFSMNKATTPCCSCSCSSSQ